MIQTPILSNPKHGWCTFQLGEFIGTPSYITDVPAIILDTIITYLNNHIGAAIFDEEGSEFTFIIEDFESFIIAEREKTQYFNIRENANDIINNIIQCIQTDIDNWAAFDAICSESKEEYEKAVNNHKNELIQKLKTIQQIQQHLQNTIG